MSEYEMLLINKPDITHHFSLYYISVMGFSRLASSNDRKILKKLSLLFVRATQKYQNNSHERVNYVNYSLKSS